MIIYDVKNWGEKDERYIGIIYTIFATSLNLNLKLFQNKKCTKRWYWREAIKCRKHVIQFT